MYNSFCKARGYIYVTQMVTINYILWNKLSITINYFLLPSYDIDIAIINKIN